MYLTVRQKLKHLSKEEYISMRELSRAAKNLYNQAVYNIRQYYFQENKYLDYQKNNSLLKSSSNYKTLNSNMSQQILKEADGCFKSYFALLKKKDKGMYNAKVRLPYYLPKNGFATLVIGFVRLNGDTLVIPYSNSFKTSHKKIVIKIPPVLLDKKIKEIRIIPKSNARFFEVQYIYEVQNEERNLDKTHALGIDLGIDNLAACVTNKGRSFIIDGRRLKSINQWFNKENARLQGIKDKQEYGKTPTLRQKHLYSSRNNKVNDYMAKTARKIINYCLENNIGTLVCGYNKTFQKRSRIGRINNQNFVNIPFGKLREKLEYLCELYGMDFVEQEESYTSKSSFFDKDILPVFEPDKSGTYSFLGRRIKRGLYKSSEGYLYNADINGALNILRKSNVVDLTVLYSRGGVDTPARIRIA